jgi:hypothetical protein
MKIKTMKEIVSDMAGYMVTIGSKITNFNPGSIVRTLFEAVATEIEQLYFKMKKGHAEAIEGSLYTSFGFSKTPATKATGLLTLEFKAPLSLVFTISKGHSFYTVPVKGKVIYFECLEDKTVPIGETSVDVKVQCTEAGEIGNVPPLSIRNVMSPLPMVERMYNLSPFHTGLPEETTEQRKKRFSNFIGTLQRGTVDSIKYGVSQIPDVAGVNVREDVGLIYIYVHDAQGQLPDPLRVQVENLVPNYKCGGIKPIVSQVNIKKVDIDIKVSLENGFDRGTYALIIYNSISTFLERYTVGKPLLRAEIVRFIMNLDYNAILNVNLSIDKDVIAQDNELVRPGKITINVE